MIMYAMFFQNGNYTVMEYSIIQIYRRFNFKDFSIKHYLTEGNDVTQQIDELC